MTYPNLDPAAVMQTVKILVRENPELAALLLLIVLAMDALYVYRTIKRAWKKSPHKPADAQSSKRNSPETQ